MKKLIVVLSCLAGLAGTAAPASAQVPGRCGLPNKTPLWIDFADGSVPFWKRFARPGTIAAAANFIYPPRLRSAGAKTIYWDMYLNSRRVGTPNDPADPEDVVERAHRLFDYAAASSACATPWIAENELFGASLPTPWSPSNVQYRANVLLYLRTLASRGARPFLLVSSVPYTAGEAGDWWRQVAQVADIVREVYFPAPAIHRQGAALGSRTLRMAFRRGITDFTSIGIPRTKLGIMLGFHTEAGTGGREGLKPAHAWFETVKWQALAARRVAKELRFATIWSWGWANWGERGLDPDKEAAACVWLWTRNPSLCNGPALAGHGFNASLTDGQLDLPSGVKCRVDGRSLHASELGGLTRLTGDRQVAYSALFARAAESRAVRVDSRQILAAERMIVALRFGGSHAGYRAALRRAGATVGLARGVIADELRRVEMKRRFRVRPANASEIADYHVLYKDVLARPVEVTPAAPWLGRSRRGFALSSTAPPRVFSAPAGRRVVIQSFNGRYTVRALGNPRPLGVVPISSVRSAIAAALADFARLNAYERWSIVRQRAALRRAVCAEDELPAVAEVDLTTYLPFLALT